FRREVVRRRIEFELRKAEARHHILEGLKIALDHLDAVITLIRGSKTVSEARDGLMTQYGLSPAQSQAILDMQLQRLTGLERQKILDELAELMKTIERLRAILASERLLMQMIVDELKAVRDAYGDDRRTEIVDATGEINVEDLIAEEDMAITVSNTGYIKRTAISTYRDGRGRRRRRDRGAGDRRHRRGLHRHPERDGHPLRGDWRAAHGPHGLRRARDHAERRRLRGRDGGGETWRYTAHRH